MAIIFDLFRRLLDIVIDGLYWLLEKFLEAKFFDKLVVFNSVPAFLAVILPIAEYKIFDGFNTINNPLAVEMIGVVFVMIITIYFSSLFTFILRLIVNAYYLIYILYLHLSHNITNSPFPIRPGYELNYELTSIYYLSVGVPVFYIVFTLLGFFFERDY